MYVHIYNKTFSSSFYKKKNKRKQKFSCWHRIAEDI